MAPFVRSLRGLIPVFDLAVAAIAYLGAFYLRFDGVIPVAHISQFWIFFAALPLLRMLVNFLFGMYRHVWRYIGVREAMAIALAVLTGSAIFSLLLYVSNNASFPRSIVFIEALLSVMMLGGVRFGMRYWAEVTPGPKQSNSVRTLIVGAGDAGEMLARDILRHPEGGLVPVGFVDDRKEKHGLRIHGVAVHGDRHAIASLVERLKVDLIVVAMPSAPQRVQKEILRLSAATPARVQTIPALQEIVQGTVSISHLRDIQIEDLLGRDPVVVDQRLLSYLPGRRVLVSGAGGSIGSELCRQIAAFGPSSLVLFDQAENPIYHIEQELRERFPDLPVVPVIADMRDRQRVEAIFAAERPEVVLHAAAHKHVPLMEANPVEAAANNVFGSLNLAEAAHAAGVSHFVLISTDKAVRPTNVMGKTKRCAELILQNLAGSSATQFVAVRFGNVLGSSGSVVPRFRRQIAQGGPITVTHPDMTRYFMTIPEAVTLVLQAATLGRSGEVLMLDMGVPVKILDLARNLIKLSGLREDDVEIVFSGIRPGEKLYEELLITSEGTRPTEHPQVFAAKAQHPPDPHWWGGVMARLQEAVQLQSAHQVRAVLDSVIARDGFPEPLASPGSDA
ncbi:polysaccharide biosynthesis protein [bacterium]|nr:polysaccharide biosynthesis protein [bacterium]